MTHCDLYPAVSLAPAMGRLMLFTGPAYRTELTAIGEQLVIPGCEKNLAPGARQLDLF